MRQQTQASHDCHAPVDEVPQLTCVHASQLPPEALSLLSQPAPFVLHNHELWPAAERWGARDFLEAELARLSCAVLSAPASRKEFSYWMPPRRHVTLERAIRAGGDRVLGPYAFDEPSVTQLNLEIGDFFRLADGTDPNGRNQCFYLQHQVVKQVAAEGARMGAAPGIGARMRDDIDQSLNRGLLERIRTAGDLGPWSLTVLVRAHTVPACRSPACAIVHHRGLRCFARLQYIARL